MKTTGSPPVHIEAHRSDGTPKSQLYCRICGHASPPDGDWIDISADGDDSRRLITCPECGSTITERANETDLENSDERAYPSD